MALVTILHPAHPAVAATMRLWTERRAELTAHIGECQTCTRHSPMRYRSCKTGRGLATAVIAARTAVINADAAAATEQGRT